MDEATGEQAWVSFKGASGEETADENQTRRGKASFVASGFPSPYVT